MKKSMSNNMHLAHQLDLEIEELKRHLGKIDAQFAHGFHDDASRVRATRTREHLRDRITELTQARFNACAMRAPKADDTRAAAIREHALDSLRKQTGRRRVYR